MITNGNWGADVRGYRGFGKFGDVVFQRGNKGEDVKLLQTYLTAAGFPVGAIDGIFGAATETAVIRFQLEYMRRATRTNVDPANGIVDQATFAALAQAGGGVSVIPSPGPGPTSSNVAPTMVMPEMTIEGQMPPKPFWASVDWTLKKKLMVGGAVLLGLAGVLYLTGKGDSKSPKPSMAGRYRPRRHKTKSYYRKTLEAEWPKQKLDPHLLKSAKVRKAHRLLKQMRKQLKKNPHLSDNGGSTKIWKQIRPGKWEVERVVSADPREQKRWLEILKSDEPAEKFKLSKTKPTGLNRYKRS